nr:putative sulfate exporter family transporter [Mesorhizobium sp. WSM3868]
MFGTIIHHPARLPLVAPVLGLDQHGFGLRAGASIHDMAQVIGVGFQNDALWGGMVTVAKLTRVANCCRF